MKKDASILKQAINACRKHIARLNNAHEKMKQFMPLNAQKFVNLNEDEIEHTDQFIFRFSSLQDAIGNKLFKALLTFLGEEISGKPFIDLFNRLEQLSIIDNYDLWIEMRKIRNELAHEYEEDPKETADKLNNVYDKKSALERYFYNIESYLRKKDFIF